MNLNSYNSSTDNQHCAMDLLLSTEDIANSTVNFSTTQSIENPINKFLHMYMHNNIGYTRCWSQLGKQVSRYIKILLIR